MPRQSNQHARRGTGASADCLVCTVADRPESEARPRRSAARWALSPVSDVTSRDAVGRSETTLTSGRRDPPEVTMGHSPRSLAIWDRTPGVDGQIAFSQPWTPGGYVLL